MDTALYFALSITLLAFAAQLREALRRERFVREMLERQEEEYRDAFESAALPMAQVELRNGVLLHVNDAFCKLVGYRREELLCRTLFDLVHPDDRARRRQGHDDVVANKLQVYTDEIRYVRKEGSPIWVQVNVTVSRNPEGKPIRSTTILREISAPSQPVALPLQESESARRPVAV